MCTTPNETCLRSFFLKVFFLPFFSGAAVPAAAAAGFAIKWSLVVRRWSFAKALQPAIGFGQRPMANDRRRSLCFCRRFLAVCNRSLARPFPGACIGVRALSTDRQIAAMTEPAIGADFDEPLDAHRHFFAQVAFDQALAFDHLTDAIHLVFAEVLHLLHRVHVCLRENAR